MSSFNPQEFMNQVSNEANDTRITPCPEGEYIGVLGEPKLEERTSQKTGETYLQLTIPVTVDDPAAKEATGRDPLTVRWQSFIDRTENGGLNFGQGKNIKLGRLREATGLNKPGEPFSIGKLQGKIVKIAVKHRPDPTDSETIYDEVSKVMAFS